MIETKYYNTKMNKEVFYWFAFCLIASSLVAFTFKDNYAFIGFIIAMLIFPIINAHQKGLK